MNALVAASLFDGVEMAPRDPILGINDAFSADSNAGKVNLGVGVYYNGAGDVPLLECVRRAEALLAENPAPRTYLPIDGLLVYSRAAQALLFGADSPVVREERIVTVQALGGTGGLKLGADFLKRMALAATVWISDPSWENHRALFENAGFAVKSYPYYDAVTRSVDFSGMVDTLRRLPAGSIVVLHACCHNPTGVDLTFDQWSEVITIVGERRLIPFLDIAYQGFGEGLDADAVVLRRFAAAGGPVFIASSFSKSFSLYGERVGALSVVTASRDEAQRVLSQLKRVVRTNYSNPPTHGSRVVATVLTTPALHVLWERELAGMRDRIGDMRWQLVEKLKVYAAATDFDFILQQRGMFSYSGLSKDAVARLRKEFAIYAVDTGRICLAALNTKNVDYVAQGIARVM
ncbi:MAG: aspartate/tyrosine/aromatic aminotransferase [Gammaproteobacteria bacterium]|nr:aspartate/tyrosine/aromatic aminotransferase [Gammaproteobacteria bacterium]